jgi:hypothetical protein
MFLVYIYMQALNICYLNAFKDMRHTTVGSGSMICLVYWSYSSECHSNTHLYHSSGLSFAATIQISPQVKFGQMHVVHVLS